MGLLIDGRWQDRWYDTKASGGKFVRSQAQFRHWITVDGSPGPSGDGGFAAEPDRYHLYVSLACPWAHRTLIMRSLKGLESMVGISVVHSLMAENGWTFDTDDSGGRPSSGDALFNADYLHQIYSRSQPDYSGRVTVPVLWDKQRNCIVSNESSEIIRMFNSAFDQVGAKPGDYAPAELLDQIDAVNALVYDAINNGVYRAGFATEQSAYEQAVGQLFECLDQLEQRLSQQRYLIGDRITEADWRLFTTLIRFDSVYYGHFKCNQRQLSDYPNLWGFTRELYQWPGVAETVAMDHIKQHYYRSHPMINPTRIVPIGPDLALTLPHQRDQLS